MPDDTPPQNRSPACEQMLHNALSDFNTVAKANPVPVQKSRGMLIFSRPAHAPADTTDTVRASITAQIDNLNQAVKSSELGFINLLRIIKHAKVEAPEATPGDNTKQTMCKDLVTALRNLIQMHIPDFGDKDFFQVLRYNPVLLQALVDVSDTLENASSKIMFNGITESSDAIKDNNADGMKEIVAMCEKHGIDGAINALDNDPNKNAHAKMLQARFDLEQHPSDRTYRVRNEGKESQTSALIAVADMLKFATVDLGDDNHVSVNYSTRNGMPPAGEQHEALQNYLDGAMGTGSVNVTMKNKVEANVSPTSSPDL